MLIYNSPAWDRLRALYPTHEDRCHRELQHHTLFGVSQRLADPITFTPFAAAKACSARCWFCSETLVHRGQKRMAASLRPGPDYFARLAEVLDELRGLRLGLSLSGLEATDDPSWLYRTLDVLQEHRFVSRVLYSNTNGLDESIVDRLARFRLSRVEISRHHFDEEANNAIMNFRPGEPGRCGETFARRVQHTAERLEVRLVCVIQQTGVSGPESARAYLAWARTLGVRHVIFRELSRLHDLYEPNRNARYVERNRVEIERLLPLAFDQDFQAERLTSGYYYWNLRGSLGDMRVTFETSDYKVMKSLHDSDVIYKLILHANGSLNGDWDPDKSILSPSPSIASLLPAVAMPDSRG